MVPTKKICIVAEVAQAHEGSLGMAHSYIDVMGATGVDVIKFQTHIAEAESSIYEPFRTKFSYEDDTRFDYWRRMEFTPPQWSGLKAHCDRLGLEFLASPFSIAAVNLLEGIGVERYKVGSGELSNLLLLHRIAQTGKPVILSSGMSSMMEIEKAIGLLRPFGTAITLLQCTTAYPTTPDQWGLNVMDELSARFKLPVGFSDHSGDIYACLAAAARGASMLEFHVAFDQDMFGPDSKASLIPEKVRQLVNGVRSIERALNSPVNKDAVDKFSDLRIMFGKSLAVNRHIHKGEVISLDLLESKKPAGEGIPAEDFRSVLGKVAAKDLPPFSFLRIDDLM